jgi:putative lysine/arginine/ornithine/histidine/octopine transport system substrate-binding protein
VEKLKVKTLITSVLAVTTLIFNAGDATSGEKLRIATEGYYAPFNYYNESGELAGFDVDIGKALCKIMEAECEFIQKDWDDLISSLVSGDFDVILASMSITEEREKQVAFTISYYSNMLTFVGRGDAGLSLTKDSLKGKSVGTLRSTISADYLAEKYSDILEIRLYDTQDAAFEDLTQGKLDLVLGDNLPSYTWLQSEAGGEYAFIGEFIDINDRIGIAVRQEDEELREKLDLALIEILEDGTYQEINDKYFPFSIYF